MDTIDIFTLEFNEVDQHYNATAHATANGTRYAITIDPTESYVLQVRNLDSGESFSSGNREQQPILDELFGARDWRNFLAITNYDILRPESERLKKVIAEAQEEIDRKTAEIADNQHADGRDMSEYLNRATSDALLRVRNSYGMLHKIGRMLSVSLLVLGDDFEEVRSRYRSADGAHDEEDF